MRMSDLPSQHIVQITFEDRTIMMTGWAIVASLEKLFWSDYSYEIDL